MAPNMKLKVVSPNASDLEISVDSPRTWKTVAANPGLTLRQKIGLTLFAILTPLATTNTANFALMNQHYPINPDSNRIGIEAEQRQSARDAFDFLPAPIGNAYADFIYITHQPSRHAFYMNKGID